MYPFFQIPFMGRMFQWFSLGLWGLGFFFFGDLWSSKMTIFSGKLGGGRIPLNSLSQPSEGHTNVLWCISLLIFWLVLYFLYTYLSQGPLTTVHRFQPRPIDTLVRELKYPHWKGFGPDVQFIRYFPPPERVTPPPLNVIPWKDPSSSTVPFTRYTPLQQPHWKSFTPLFRLTCIFTHIWRSSPPPMSYRERYPPSSTVLFIGYTPLQCPHWKVYPMSHLSGIFNYKTKK